ncbi:MAG: fructose 1,6-bisphosphatase, partial [Candidatus Omnitrophota bacterium]|nr:fructose 1,6-bisphosphatase [Candidatus Omnitrophota bacterium]
ILEAIKEGCLSAQQLGLLKIDIRRWNLAELAEAMRVKHREHSITERGSEPVVIAKLIGAGIGAANLILYHEFFMPGSTPLVKLGFLPVKEKGDKGIARGFRAVVRRTDDVFKGRTDGDVWEFEFSSAANVDGVQYNDVNETQELLALASQPNDYVITGIYAVEGSAIPTTEPLVSLVYQPVYGEKGDSRTLNPSFIFRSQSGGDAVGGVASMFYNANFVPGGPNGENFVAIKPVTLEEARKAPEEGIANAVVYGWMSEGNGIISRVVDHVGINPPALSYIRSLAKWLAGIMKTHKDDQPYLAPFAAEAGVKEIRKQHAALFKHAPKEAEIDAVMDEVEAQVASGKL